jgi:hypothetical protein
MAETAENDPVDSSRQSNGALKDDRSTSDTPETPETSEMAAVRIAREAFFARARENRPVPEAPSSEAPLVATAAPTPTPPEPKPEGVGGVPSDISRVVSSPSERIASRHSGEGLLAVGVLSDLGGERAYRVWATADSEDLKSITDPQARAASFETIVDNMRMPQYREALSLVDHILERDALRALNARGEARVDGPAPAINDAAKARSTVEPITQNPALEERVTPAAPEEENVIEAVQTPKRELPTGQVSDAEKRREAEEKTPRRNAGARLLDAFTRSFVGRERAGGGNEMSSPAVMTKDGYAVPETIASRYVVRDGDFWRFDEKNGGDARDTRDHAPSFTDKGPRLATAGHDRGTVADMVTVAQAKGWQQVTLKGSEAFRRNAWVETQLAGIKTQGFEPKERDRALLEAARRERDSLTITAGRHSPEPSRPPSTAIPAPTSQQASERPAHSPNVAAPGVRAPTATAAPADSSIQAVLPTAAPAAPITSSAPATPNAVSASGLQVVSEPRSAPAELKQNVLLEHGAAPYKNDKGNADNYYVSYRESDGATKTVWGKDLERAIRDSGVQPGDALTLENLGSRPVTVNRPVKDAEGKVVRVDQIDTRLNVWEIQKQEKQSPGSHDSVAGAMNVAALREQVEKALAGQPDNVVREVMDRLAERLQAGIAVQAEHQQTDSLARNLKPALDTRLAQVDVDREARQAVTEAPKPQRNPERDVAKQSAPNVAR